MMRTNAEIEKITAPELAKSIKDLLKELRGIREQAVVDARKRLTMHRDVSKVDTRQAQQFSEAVQEMSNFEWVEYLVLLRVGGRE